MYAVVMFLYTFYVRTNSFYFRTRLQTANQIISNNFKTPMSPEPFVSCAKAPPAKRNEKGYGDKNDDVHEATLSQFSYIVTFSARAPDALWFVRE